MKENESGNPLEKIKSKPLNDLVSYFLVNPKEISVHVVPTESNLQNKVSLIREGFVQLAQILETDPRFSEVEAVTATSWIGMEHPNSLRYFGFEVDENQEHPLAKRALQRYSLRRVVNVPREYWDIEPMFAFMSREDFLVRYGSQSDGQSQRNL